MELPEETTFQDNMGSPVSCAGLAVGCTQTGVGCYIDCYQTIDNAHRVNEQPDVMVWLDASRTIALRDHLNRIIATFPPGPAATILYFDGEPALEFE